MMEEEIFNENEIFTSQLAKREDAFVRKAKENALKNYLAKFKIFRSDYGFNIAACNSCNYRITHLNNYNDIMELCLNNYDYIPALALTSTTDYMLVTVPEAIDKRFDLQNATKFKITYKVDGKKISNFIYGIKVPEYISDQLKSQPTRYVLDNIYLYYQKPYIIDPCAFYEKISNIKIKDTVVLDEFLLNTLEELAKQVKEFNDTFWGNLEFYPTINEPDFSKYRIGKTLLKNLSIYEPINNKLIETLSQKKQKSIKANFIKNTGLGGLTVNERRILEAILIVISNSKIVYATEVPDAPQKFVIPKEVFINKIIYDKHLKNVSAAEEIMESLGHRTFLFPTRQKNTKFKTCVISDLFKFENKADYYIFTVPPFIFSEMLAIKESAFFAQRERGFYNLFSTKVGLSTYTLLDYFDYVRNQPSKGNVIPIKANLSTLLEKVGLLKHKSQGYKYIYKHLCNAIKFAVNKGFIEPFNITFENFINLLKNTSSLGINVIKPAEDNDFSLGNSVVQDKGDNSNDARY